MTTVQLLKIDNLDASISDRYKEIIEDQTKFIEHVNIIHVLKSDDHIFDNCFGDLKPSNKDITKLRLLRQLENFYKMNPLALTAFANVDDFETLGDALFCSIKRSFETRKDKPMNRKDLPQFYVMLIKQLTSKDTILRRMNRKRGPLRDTMIYTVNKSFIQYHIDLDKCRNPELQKSS